MSQLSGTPVRRTGGGVDVYTGLMLIAFLVLGAGIALLVMKNLEHSATDGRGGGVITLVEKR